MEIKKIHLIYFSPTRTTKQVLHHLASGFSGVEVIPVDITYPHNDFVLDIPAGELAIFGAPVYGGRIARVAVERLKNIRTTGAPAIIAAVYGNREFEDALIELKDLVEAHGFKPLAACTFIGEHSFSEQTALIAPGRPDAEDIKMVKQYGMTIQNHLQKANALSEMVTIKVPGNVPYKKGVGSIPFTPEIDDLICTQCGECLPVCPTGAITLTDSVKIDMDTCIFCCSCKKSCPETAIAITAPPIREKMKFLSHKSMGRKEPQLFLA